MSASHPADELDFRSVFEALPGLYLVLDRQPWVRLHGKGDKWRSCPLWKETAECLRRLVAQPNGSAEDDSAVFLSPRGTPLTRFGVYKVVRRHGGRFDASPMSKPGGTGGSLAQP